MNNDILMNAFNWRYATKIFDKDKKINNKDWKVLTESLRLAPSSFGLQPWKFIIVENEEIRKELREHSFGQSQVTDASHFVVFTYMNSIDEEYIEKYMKSISQQRGVDRQSLQGYFDVIKAALIDGPRSTKIPEWAQRQSYIAMGQLMLTAAVQNIDTCPLEGLIPTTYDKILGLEGTNYKTIGAVALGHRSPEDKYSELTKVRFNEEEIFKII